MSMTSADIADDDAEMTVLVRLRLNPKAHPAHTALYMLRLAGLLAKCSASSPRYKDCHVADRVTFVLVGPGQHQ